MRIFNWMGNVAGASTPDVEDVVLVPRRTGLEGRTFLSGGLQGAATQRPTGRRGPLLSGPRRPHLLSARRITLAAAWVVTGMLVAVCLPATPALATEGSCPNEARRAEQSSTYLPNCRAYEQVTPVAKNSGEPQARYESTTDQPEPVRGVLSALDGERIAWDTEYPGLAEPASTGLDYLSTRGAGGWNTEELVPAESPDNGLACPENPGIVGWSRNFTKGVLQDGQSGAHECDGRPEPALKEADGTPIAEPEGVHNLFLRDNESPSYQLVDAMPTTAPYFTSNASFLAGSAHLDHVAFEEEGHGYAYVWSEGQTPAVRLVTVSPGGTAVEGIVAGSTRNAVGFIPHSIADYRHVVSADGSRIFFEAAGKLYVRENAGEEQSEIASGSTAVDGEQCTEPEKACTIQLDLPEEGAAGSGEGGKWLGANAEGTEVFFTDDASAGLTKSTQAGSGVNLYEYELPSAADTPGTLIDLTPAANAEVLGISGISEDGSYVYFVADAALPNSGKNSEKAEAQAGHPNLYLAHEGAAQFIATLTADDECDWTSNTGCYPRPHSNPGETGSTARVSGNGLYVGFNSARQLTTYANEGADEIYLYEAAGNSIACVSCNPTGPPSAGGAALKWPTTIDRSGNILRNTYPQRNVSESGQVFFDTSEALLPNEDTNGVRDVYEWQPNGTGGCEVAGGCLSLISSGTSTAPSYFLDASTSGSDVFLATAQKLVGWDTDSAYDIYDAREYGGFPEPPVAPPPCEGEECKAAASPTSVFQAPASVAFHGAGNVKPPTPQPAKKQESKTKHLTRHQEVRRALHRCKHRFAHNKHRRHRCKRHARKRYGAKTKGARAHRHHHRQGSRNHGGAK